MTKVEVTENFTISKVFSSKSDLDTWISAHQSRVKAGELFLIQDTTSSCYWWDGSRLVEWKAGSTTPIDLTDYVTKTGEETLTNKTFHGTQIQNLGLNYSNAFKVTRAGSSTVVYARIPTDANYCYLVNTSGTQRLTNKQFSSYCKIADGTLFSKDAGTITFPNPASGETVTLATTDDIPSIDLSNYVTLEGRQTLSNKTLTSSCKLYTNRLQSQSGGDIIFPDTTTGTSLTLATRVGVETIKNKTFEGSAYIIDNIAYSEAFKIKRASYSNTTSVRFPDTGTVNLVSTTAAQTLGNKTLGNTCKIGQSTLLSASGGVITFPDPSSGSTSTLATTADIAGIDLSNYATKTGEETLSNKTLASTCKIGQSYLISTAGGTITFPNPSLGTNVTLATAGSDSSALETKINILMALLTNAGIINNDLEVEEVTGTEFNTILQSVLDNTAAVNNVKSVTLNKNYHITTPVSEKFSALENLGNIKVQLSIDYLKVSSSFLGFYDSSKILSLTPKWWDVSGMTTMAQMFYMDTSLTSLDLSKWDTSNVQSMNSIFYKCSSLATLNVSTWNTSKVTGLNGTFYQCSSLLSLDVLNWDTSNVQDMGYLFNSCSGFRTLDLRNWVDNKVTNMARMFNACTSLQTINLASFTGGALSNSTSMFAGCDNLATLICKPSLLRKVVANGETNLTIDPSALLDKEDSTTYVWTVSNLTIQSGTPYSS